MDQLSLLLCCCLALPTIGYRLKRARNECGIDGASPENCRPSKVCERPPICKDPCMWRCVGAGHPHYNPGDNTTTTTLPPSTTTLPPTTTTVPPPPCGQSFMPPPSSTSFVSIVGGQTAPVGGIPWQVALGYAESTKEYFACGGSYVLNSRNEVKVITAAHCIPRGIANNRKYFVWFGMHDLTDRTGVVKVDATSIVRHPVFRTKTRSSDIAIISFSGLDFNALSGTYASPICLVSTGYTPGEMTMVSGWGLTTESSTISPRLQYVNIPIVDYNYCNTDTVDSGQLDSTMLCAGLLEGGKDSCKGDSGGPLAVYRDNQWQLAGVVSWSWGCARENSPSVYADVNSLIQWIDENL